ncbi:MAG: glycosyltransferase [Natronincolaceae bacterium]|nr:glycosyltransferase [Bacillota bacterium]
MKELKICVYAICKNESKFVERWMDSMNEADLIVVTDMGSTDDTREKLKKKGAVVYSGKVEPWRFDTARNISLEHVPNDVDICVCTDLDELFEPGWREKLEEAWFNYKPMHNGTIAKTGRYIYNWSLKPDGTADTQFYNFKVHERHGFQWECPIHEYLKYIGTPPLEIVFIEGMVLNHHPDPTKSRASYLPLLEMAVKEAPHDSRMRYYLGREYMYQDKWQDCINTLKFYLKMPNAIWNEERCAAMRWIAKSCYKLKRTKEAYMWYYKAVGEAPHMRDPYIEFSIMCYELGDWPMTFALAQEALKIREKSRTFINMGHSWDHTPNDLSAISAYYMNMFETAHEHSRKALDYSPDNERLKNNLKIIGTKVTIMES